MTWTEPSIGPGGQVRAVGAEGEMSDRLLEADRIAQAAGRSPASQSTAWQAGSAVPGRQQPAIGAEGHGEDDREPAANGRPILAPVPTSQRWTAPL